MTIHRTTAQRVADQADRTEAHQAPADHRAIETGEPLKNVRQIGVGGEHATEHHDRQQNVPEYQRAAQDAELRAKAHLMLVQVGFRQIDKQQQRLGESDDRQNAERTAPAECIGNQRAHRNAEHRGADDAEADLGDGATA
ncbi:hypothetical protein D3C76_1260760 [compost metagenome]